MPTLSLGEMASATGGSLLRGDPEARVGAFSIDTRALPRGGVFFALRGTRADGHAFLLQAASAGAAAAVVQEEIPAGAEAPPALLRVGDTARALARCGALARRKLRLDVVGVTGSVGKTTTKEFAAAGLSARRRVHRTVGNLNNELGVPLTLLACPDDAEVAVVEMGMRAPGEIAELARIADPDVALVTNVRPVHMEFFRTLDDVAASKGEIFAVLRPEATAVVNLDDEQVRVQAARHAGPRVTFGRGEAADLRLESVEDGFLPGAALSVSHGGSRCTLRLRCGGAHAAHDALAALAAVLAAGGDLDAAARAIAGVEPGPGRGRIHTLSGGAVVVDDSYNSNPAALTSVLETLRATPCTGRKVLVMGDMLELGSRETALHREAGRQAAAAGVRLLVGVGPRSRAAVDSARQAGVPQAFHEEDATAAARSVPGRIGAGDVVVVKGSRGVRLELVVEALAGSRAAGDA